MNVVNWHHQLNGIVDILL